MRLTRQRKLRLNYHRSFVCACGKRFGNIVNYPEARPEADVDIMMIALLASFRL